MSTLVLRVKSWGEFQHYKDRNPIWIKLHKKLLDDYEFQSLPVASRALAPMLWLLASETNDGEIKSSFEKMSFRLRMSEHLLVEALRPLIKSEFIELLHDASTLLSDCERESIPEKRREEDIQREQKPLAAAAAVPLRPSLKAEPPEPSQHATLRQMAQDKWLHHNPEVPTCPWGPAEGNQLKLLIGKTPRWPTSQYAQCMENLFNTTGFAVSTPPAEWLVKLPKYLKGPLNEYGKTTSGSGPPPPNPAEIKRRQLRREAEYV